VYRELTESKFLLLTAAVWVAGLLAPVQAAALGSKIVFNRDIRPILAENCFACHGPDPGSRKASLRLDREEGFFGQRKDGPVVIKGQPEKSPLYQRLASKDEDEIMPPPKSRHVLKPEEIARFRDWIAEGAPWQPHWSFVKPERPPLPEVKNVGWVRNPIDRFTLAKLESHGLAPAPEADAYTLARRLALDLTGLPPAPELVEKFLIGWKTDPYSRLVDRLMASPHYGEHRAHYWLDAARYADTHGMNGDSYREAWPYRDWVIGAFNRNMPFDQFTIEQIAGDLLPNPTEAQLTATGFHRCNITTSEGGTIAEENLANYARERVETTSWVWLGLTANCAVCHDHKFDPITTKDFYAMSAFFRNTTQEALDKNLRDAPPVLVMPASQDAGRWKAVCREIEVGNAAMAERRKQLAPEFPAWSQAATPKEVSARIEGNVVSFPLTEGSARELHGTVAGAPRTLPREKPYACEATQSGQALVLDKETLLDFGDAGNFERDQAFSVSAWIRTSSSGELISRVDAAQHHRGWAIRVQDEKIIVTLIHEWPNSALVTVATDSAMKPNDWRLLTVTYDGSGKGDGVRVFFDGRAGEMRSNGGMLAETIRSAAPLRMGKQEGRQCFTGAVQAVQIFDRVLTPVEIQGLLQMPGALHSATRPAAERTERDREQLLDVYLAGDAGAVAISRKVGRFEREKQEIQNRSTVTPIQQERSALVPAAHVLRRGQYDQKGEEVGPAVFSALHPMPKNAPRNRLGLAQWLVDPENPLTARVIVNRMWQEVFGTGLVKSTEDFGIMSEAPSHPELLDWLAVEFRESGWDMKHMMRLIVTSATYRQAAALTPEKLERDPQNRLLSRGPRFRMDAEMVRDYALAASGELSRTIGGPSVRPYQPDGVWEAVALPGTNTRNYKRDSGEALYRRSLYTFWKRSAPPASMEVFNAPTRETSCLRRDRTDTPLQALVTLNDTQFVEAARVLAGHALSRAAGDEAKALDYIARCVLCRPLRPAEETILKKNQRNFLAYYSNHPEDTKAFLAVGDARVQSPAPPPQLAAWTMTCSQLLNLDEVLNK
jgi:mono/diheme cytochrome c family protein